MAGTMKYFFCTKKDFISQRREIVFFLPSNMAAMRTLCLPFHLKMFVHSENYRSLMDLFCFHVVVVVVVVVVIRLNESGKTEFAGWARMGSVRKSSGTSLCNVFIESILWSWLWLHNWCWFFLLQKIVNFSIIEVSELCMLLCGEINTSATY